MHNKDKMGRQLNMDELEQVTGGVQGESGSKVDSRPANIAYAGAVLDHPIFKASPGDPVNLLPPPADLPDPRKST